MPDNRRTYENLSRPQHLISRWDVLALLLILGILTMLAWGAS